MLVFHWFYHYFLRGQEGHEYSRESLGLSERERLGGGRGRVNPPPRRLVWRFWEVWRVCCFRSHFGSSHVGSSTREWFYKTLGLGWSRFGVTLGQLLACEGDFGGTLAPFWDCFGANLGI